MGREGFVPEAVVVEEVRSVHVLNYNSPGATGAPAFSAHLVWRQGEGAPRRGCKRRKEDLAVGIRGHGGVLARQESGEEVAPELLIAEASEKVSMLNLSRRKQPTPNPQPEAHAISSNMRCNI